MANNICSVCGSSWNTSKVLTKCPFCGKTILIENEDNNEQLDMVGLLIKIRDTYGVGVFENKHQAISIMKDFAPYLDHEIRLFKLGLEANVYISFSKIKKGELQQIEAINRITSVLVDDYFLNEKSVNAIIIWFMELFSLSQPSFSGEEKKAVAQQLVSALKAISKKASVVSNKQAKLASETTKEPLLTMEKLHDTKGHCIYEGYTKKGKRHGIGTSFFENGTKEYDGEWYSDVKSGLGTLYNRSGSIVYSGEWLNGRMHGRGELHSYEGVYIGSFANDKKIGKGLMKYKNGREEQQEWHYGTRVIDEVLSKAFMNLYISFDENYIKTNYNLILEFANEGNSDAQFFIGKCYDKGIVVKEDKVEANRWYKKAADQGNSCAVHNIGSLLEGQGSAYSSQAIDYFKKALKQGEMLAAWNLGRIYRLRWKSNPDVNWLINADTYLSEGLALQRPNRYTTEKIFLKYKYECAAMAQRNATAIAEYFGKKLKKAKNDHMNFYTSATLYINKRKEYESIMLTIKNEMLTKYKTDVTKMDW